jgi:hypothetical protein
MGGSAGQRRHGGFRIISVTGDRLAVYGWLFDAKNPDSPQILGKQYNEAPARIMRA